MKQQSVTYFRVFRSVMLLHGQVLSGSLINMDTGWDCTSDIFIVDCSFHHFCDFVCLPIFLCSNFWSDRTICHNWLWWSTCEDLVLRNRALFAKLSWPWGSSTTTLQSPESSYFGTKSQIVMKKTARVEIAVFCWRPQGYICDMGVGLKSFFPSL